MQYKLGIDPHTKRGLASSTQNFKYPRYGVGVDIGGTKIRAVLLNNKNKFLRAFDIPTPQNKKSFLKVLENKISKIVENKKISGISVGLAGIIDVKKGALIKAPNLPFLKNWQVKKFFQKFSKSIKIDNDARVFLRGELSFGAARSAKKALVFTIGTGIGRAFADKGKIRKIKKFEYPEKWEKQYQRSRDSKNDEALIAFLAPRLLEIIKKYKPITTIIGGGVLKRKNFFNRLNEKLRGKNKQTKFKKAVLGDFSGAIGAALM